VHTLAPRDADAGGDGGAGWRIGYTVHDGARSGHPTEPSDGPAERTAHATRLVLAAGTLGTQRLLQRNANALPALSRRLGRGVSANGDLLTFAVGCTPELRPSRGPVITTTVARREGEGGAFLQDAGFPAVGEWLFHAIGAAPGLWGERRLVLDLVLSAFRKRSDANLSAELSRLLGAARAPRTSCPCSAWGATSPRGGSASARRDS
jgi:cholesterol oxidase